MRALWALALLLLVVSPAAAANPNREPMSLSSSEYAENFDEMNYGAINGCQDEDDKDRRWYSGWLAAGESFSPDPVIFCSTVTDETGDGNTGAWMEVMGDTRFLIEWWSEAPQRIVDGQVISERFDFTPTLIDSKDHGKPSEFWRGCEAEPGGPVYLTITNVGSRGAYTVLGFGSRWHDTWGVFKYDCP